MIKAKIKAALNTVPLSFWQWLFPKSVIVPFYHMVSDDDLAYLKYYPYKNAKQFEADVAYVHKHYRFIDYRELARLRLHKADGRPNAFLFTFDDGFAECFSVIRPILLKYGASGVFFVPTDSIDNNSMFFENKLSLCISAAEARSPAEANELVLSLKIKAALRDSARKSSIETAKDNLLRSRTQPTLSRAHRLLILYLLSLEQHEAERINQVCEKLGVDPASYLFKRRPYLTSDQIRQLAGDGFVIGGHGISHLRLQRMSEAEIEREIVNSCEAIREITCQKKVPFSFPYSGEGLRQNFLTDILRRYDFIELFFDTGGFRKNAPYIVDRFWADCPDASASHNTNLPHLLRREWCRRQAWIR